MILVDSNVIFDVWDRDPVWVNWSTQQLRELSRQHDLAINSIVYAEISARFTTQPKLDAAVEELGLMVLEIPREAAFLAGKAFAQYRRRGGPKTNVLSDLFIGAQAAVLGCDLLTRDTRRYSTYFPSVRLIAP